jgi:alpha-L-rhamnosidase
MNGQSQTILSGYLGAWMYQTLGGIGYDSTKPGFKNIIMHPEPVGDLTWVNSSFQSLYGQITSNWKKENGLFTWKVTIPANTTATLYIPTKDPGSVKEGDNLVKDNPFIKFEGMEHGAAVYEIGSGAYEFSAYPL